MKKFVLVTVVAIIALSVMPATPAKADNVTPVSGSYPPPNVKVFSPRCETLEIVWNSQAGRLVVFYLTKYSNKYPTRVNLGYTDLTLANSGEPFPIAPWPYYEWSASFPAPVDYIYSTLDFSGWISVATCSTPKATPKPTPKPAPKPTPKPAKSTPKPTSPATASSTSVSGLPPISISLSADAPLIVLTLLAILVLLGLGLLAVNILLLRPRKK